MHSRRESCARWSFPKCASWLRLAGLGTGGRCCCSARGTRPHDATCAPECSQPFRGLFLFCTRAKLGRSGARDSGPGRLKKVALEMFGNPPHLPLPPEFRMCLLQCSCFHLSTCIGETYVYNVRVYGVICGRQRRDLVNIQCIMSNV